MPELPEVETIRLGLAEVLPGKRIKKLDLRLPKWVALMGKAPLRKVNGATIKGVNRRGKLLLIELSTKSTLLIHLKMTGQLIFREKQSVVLAGGHPIPTVKGDLPAKVTHAIFHFSDGSELFFNDLRQFGYVRAVPTDEVDSIPIMQTFGPEPLSRQFSFPAFEKLLARRPKAKLKPLLLDQTFVAGLGNIYVDEALNLARLHPLRTVSSLKPAQRRALYDAIRAILRRALRFRGTSDNSYVNIRGGKGDYLKHARVYHRVGEPCRKCKTAIKRMVVAGRGTHFCPRCQPTTRGAK